MYIIQEASPDVKQNPGVCENIPVMDVNTGGTAGDTVAIGRINGVYDIGVDARLEQHHEKYVVSTIDTAMEMVV